MLPLLTISDIWHEGRLAVSPDYQVESFKGLRIGPETTAFVKAGLAVGDHFLLPLNRHPWHRSHTQSYCVSVALADERRLLMPCIELIRFYFGSSGKLIQRLFAAPLRQETLWTSKRFNPANRHLHLVLASGLPGASATDIGRAAESQYAWRAAAGIHASCQKAAAQRQQVYPYTGFPFEGTTNLTASGIWLPFGDRESATFLVYRIRSCSHPFPFDSLSYEASDRKARHDGKGSDGTGASTFARGRNHGGARRNTTDSDPGSNRASRAAFFRRPPRFPDLVRKQVWRETMEVAPKADIFLRQPDGHLELVAFGESEGYSAVSGVDPIQDAEKRAFSEEEPALPHFVRAGLKELAGKPENAKAQITLVCPPGKTHPIFSVPMVIDEEGEIASELLFALPDGRVRQRRACFVRMGNEDTLPRHLLIFEAETRLAHPHIVAATTVALAEAVKLALDTGTKGKSR